MAKIELVGVTKRFGKLTALNDVTLTIRDKEFFVLFGPAGAGKTTILNNIAGIQVPTQGMIKIGGSVVNQMDPAERNVAMVFENYALYPHMTVYDNIASPLRNIKEAVHKVSKLMKIDMLLERLPSQLSNGQRQRVALGRALVREPSVFLLDEPLAHLDAKLKHTMRAELKEMQSAFNTTTIYVTHDYMEAMSLADRIAVLDKGKLVQLGTALEMYYTPGNEFVAKLFGEPEINILPAEYRVEAGKGIVETGIGLSFEVEEDVRKALNGAPGAQLDVAIRGGDIRFSFDPQPGYLEGAVYANEPIGNKVVTTVNVGGQRIRLVAPNDTRAALDQKVYIRWNTANALYFDRTGKQFITRHDVEGVTHYAGRARGGHV